MTWPLALTEPYINCSFNSFYQITEEAGGINLSTSDNSGAQETVRIFPKPTSDFIGVEFSALNHKPTYYSVTNLVGAILSRRIELHSDFAVDVQILLPGIYMLAIQSPAVIIFRRIVSKQYRGLIYPVSFGNRFQPAF